MANNKYSNNVCPPEEQQKNIVVQIGWLVGVVFVPPLLHWLDGLVKSDSDKCCVLLKAKPELNSLPTISWCKRTCKIL